MRERRAESRPGEGFGIGGMVPEVAVSLRLLLGAGVLALAALVGSGRGPVRGIDLPLAAAGGFVVLLCLNSPGFGLALLPLVSAAVPVSIGTGTQSQVVAGLLFALLLLAMWAVRAAVSGELTLVSSPVNLPILALMLAWTLAYVYSNAVRPPIIRLWPSFPMAQVGGLGVTLVSAGILLMAMNVGLELRWIRTATWSLIGIGVLGVVPVYLRAEHLIQFLSTGGLFTMWVVALAYGQALFNRELPKWGRVALLALVGAWLYKAAVMQTLWASGWVPTLAAVVTITFFRSKPAFLALMLGGSIVAASRFDVMYGAIWTPQVNEGDMSRLDIWEQAWQLLMRFPALGTGPAGYAVYYMSLYADSAFSMSSHSNYVDVLLQTGFIGGVAFLWTLLALLVVGWRAIRCAPSGFAEGYAHGAFGGLVGVLVAMALGDWFIPFVYNVGIGGFRYTIHSWVFLGLLASLAVPRPEVRRAP